MRSEGERCPARVTLFTGTGQYSVYEDSPRASTTDPTIRYMNSLGYLPAAPSSLNGTAGDVYWNSAPKAGTGLGWVCLVGGRSATWAPFAAIGDGAGPQKAWAPATGTNNDVSTGVTSLLRLAGGAAGAVTITGLDGGADGRVLFVQNNTAQTVTFSHNDAGSQNANRIWIAGGSTSVANGGAAIFTYDAANSKWIMSSRG